MIDEDLLLHPVEYEEFFKHYWEAQPLHISRIDAAYFADLLSVDGIEQHLTNKESSFPDVQVVDASKNITTDSYVQDRTIQADQLFAHHRDGATIILAEVHKKFTAVADLCWQVNKDFHFGSQANAYLSPPGNQGFHAHYDTHDVFVLQIAGQKTFRFYPSDIELPFPDDTYNPENNKGGAVVEQVELSAGDTLYIPRGIVHDALAHAGEPSLHITLGVFPFVMRDLLQEIVQVAAERDSRYRAFVDLRNTSQHGKHGLANLQGMLNELVSEDNYREALSRLSDSIAVSSIEGATGSPVPGEQSIGPDSLMKIDESSILSVEKTQNQLKLRLAGQVIRFSEPYSLAVDALLASDLSVRELPGLDVDQGLALCRQLLAANAVTLVGDAPAVS